VQPSVTAPPINTFPKYYEVERIPSIVNSWGFGNLGVSEPFYTTINVEERCARIDVPSPHCGALWSRAFAHAIEASACCLHLRLLNTARRWGRQTLRLSRYIFLVHLPRQLYTRNTDSEITYQRTTMQLITSVFARITLVALTLSVPTDPNVFRSATIPTTAWDNTQTGKYHCEGKNVIQCENTIRGVCSVIGHCDSYCFTREQGTSCVDMGAPVVSASNDIVTIPNAPGLAPDTSLATRDASPQEDMDYTCSRNRSSVLICKYGFCSTDHYCGSGNECKDDCKCCRSVA
jgi:hypothetical protein